MSADDPDSPLRKVARGWISRLAAGEVDDRSLGELKHWRRIDTRHNAAFEAERRLYRSLQPLDLAFAQDGVPPRSTRAPAPTRGGKRLFAKASVISTCAAILLVAWWTIDPLVSFRADKVTSVGEIARMHLPDGSIALLDSDSALALDFGRGDRRVHLLRGQAWFKVVHDTRHPFLVDANGATARAVGTAFAVRRDDGRTSLAVTEGRVRFSASDGTALDVSVGEAALLTADRSRPSLMSASIDRELAWRYGRVAFENRTLAEVASLLNRYRRGRILVLGSAADRRVSGVLSVGAIDEGLAGLAAAQGLRVTHLTPWLIILS